MKRVFLPIVIATGMLCMTAAQADDNLSVPNGTLLTGDTRLACEAILCLASSTQPDECAPSLKRYFSITKKTMSDTIKARVNFLGLCPVTSLDPTMKANLDSLIQAEANGAGRCDSAALNGFDVNAWLGRWDNLTNTMYIPDKLPDYCVKYENNSLTYDPVSIRYVGTPQNGGFWVNAADYDTALAAYNARLVARNQLNDGGN